MNQTHHHGKLPVGDLPRQRGVALVAVLWVVVIAAAILVTVKMAAALQLGSAYNAWSSVQAHWLARAGVEQARAVLQDDDAAYDGPFDLWYEDAESFTDVELPTGTFSVASPPGPDDLTTTNRSGLIAHSGRINVNTAEDDQLDALLGAFNEELLPALLDWRDRNDETRPGGAESGYYQRLDYPYEIRNGPLQTVDELKLIRGFDRSVFYGSDAAVSGGAVAARPGAIMPTTGVSSRLEDRGLQSSVTVYSYEANVDSAGEARLNINQANAGQLQQELNLSRGLAQAVVENRPNNGFESLFDLLEITAEDNASDSDESDDRITEFTLSWLAGQLDSLTLSDDEQLPARINLNFADRDVLATLPQMTSEVTDAIVNFRQSSQGPFMTVGDLLGVEGVTEDVFKAIAERVTVRANVFEIHSSGTTRHGIRRSITVIVDRRLEPNGILYWYQDE